MLATSRQSANCTMIARMQDVQEGIQQGPDREAC